MKSHSSAILFFAFAIFASTYADASPNKSPSPKEWSEQRKIEFQEYDRDSDGKTDGKWTLDEYLKQLDFAIASENMPKEQVSKIKEEAKKTFALMDKNKDNIITVDEFSSEDLLKLENQQPK